MLRIGGAVLVLASVAALALTGNPGVLLPMAIGAALCLAGHWR